MLLKINVDKIMMFTKVVIFSFLFVFIITEGKPTTGNDIFFFFLPRSRSGFGSGGFFLPLRLILY